MYLDSHAGRGRHLQGQPGSPLIALTTLLNHRDVSRILDSCEANFLFLEHDPDHVSNLSKELKALQPLPEGVNADIIEADYESKLRQLLNDLEEEGASLAPSFFFVDPYGFVLPMDLMRKILNHRGSELLINLMTRYVDMAIANSKQEDNLDKLFGNRDWRNLQQTNDPNWRRAEIIRLYTESLGCQYSSVLEMRGPRREPKYSLIHATNHRRGKELMKSAMWKLSPHGSFVIYQSDNPHQQSFIAPKPDLQPLEEGLVTRFGGRSLRYKVIKDWLLNERWDYPHLNRVIRNLRDNKKLELSGYVGRFAFDKNPLLKFK